MDDPENIGNDWERDLQVILSEDCQLGLQGFDSTKIVLTPNPVKDKLWVYNDNEVNNRRRGRNHNLIRRVNHNKRNNARSC